MYFRFFFFIWIYYFTLFHILKISPDTLTPLSTGGHCWLVDGVACREDFLSSLSPNRLLSLSSEEITGGQWGLRNFMFFFSFSALWTRKLVLSRSLESLCRNFSHRSCSLFEITGGQLCFLGIIIKCTIRLWRKQILNQIGWLTSQIVGPQHLYSGRWVGSRCTGWGAYRGQQRRSFYIFSFLCALNFSKRTPECCVPRLSVVSSLSFCARDAHKCFLPLCIGAFRIIIFLPIKDY